MIMETLELKHLSSYLPYGLKVRNIFGKGSTWTLTQFNIEQFSDDDKPILRPLSDLDNYLRNEFEKLDRGYAYDKIAVDLFCEENGVSELIENTEINSLPYECVEYMFEYHYDVFGLLEKGLAIDINTL